MDSDESKSERFIALEFYYIVKLNTVRIIKSLSQA